MPLRQPSHHGAYEQGEERSGQPVQGFVVGQDQVAHRGLPATDESFGEAELVRGGEKK